MDGVLFEVGWAWQALLRPLSGSSHVVLWALHPTDITDESYLYKLSGRLDSETALLGRGTLFG